MCKDDGVTGKAHPMIGKREATENGFCNGRESILKDRHGTRNCHVGKKLLYLFIYGAFYAHQVFNSKSQGVTVCSVFLILNHWPTGALLNRPWLAVSAELHD